MLILTKFLYVTCALTMTMTMFIFYIVIIRKELYDINKFGNIIYNMTMYGDIMEAKATLEKHVTTFQI